MSAHSEMVLFIISFKGSLHFFIFHCNFISRSVAGGHYVMDSSSFKMMHFHNDINTKEQSQSEQGAGFKGQIPASQPHAGCRSLDCSPASK